MDKKGGLDLDKFEKNKNFYFISLVYKNVFLKYIKKTLNCVSMGISFLKHESDFICT